MSKREPWSVVEKRLRASGKQDFAKLAVLAGLNPARRMRFADWSAIDFTGCDFEGWRSLPDDPEGRYRNARARPHPPRVFDFTGANLCGARLSACGIGSARFDQAILGQLIHPDDPHQPARLTAPIANLRESADWEAYKRAWTRPQQWPDDAHLPIGAIFQDAPFAPEMVVVPPGRYMRGSPDGQGRKNEHTQRPVTIDYRFAVGRFPVTFEEWDFAFRVGGVEYKPDNEDRGRGRRPVIDVSWNDVVEEYLPWLNERLGLSAGSGYRLLTEAEWEYCCRAGTKTAYCNGDDPQHLGNVAWFHRNSNGTAQPVGEKDANAFGLQDMHGNVWEWCQDAYEDSYADVPDNRDARDSDDPSVSRVLRGGSWDYLPVNLRSAGRIGDRPDYRHWNCGFRLARTLKP